MTRTVSKRDEEGQVLPDVQAAHAEVLKSAQELWSDLTPDMARDEISIEIADETGETVLTVPFSWRLQIAWRMAQPSHITKEVERIRPPDDGHRNGGVVRHEEAIRLPGAGEAFLHISTLKKAGYVLIPRATTMRVTVEPDRGRWR